MFLYIFHPSFALGVVLDEISCEWVFEKVKNAFWVKKIK